MNAKLLARAAVFAIYSGIGTHAVADTVSADCAAVIVSVDGTQLSRLPVSALGDMERGVRQIALECPSKVNIASYQTVQGAVLELASKMPDNCDEMMYFMAAIRAVSPIVFQSVRETEAARGRPFTTVAEAKAIINDSEFKQRYRVDLATFCALPINAASLECMSVLATK